MQQVRCRLRPEQGPVREEITCADLVELAPGGWLPRQMRIVRYGPPWDKPAYRGQPVMGAAPAGLPDVGRASER